MVVLCVACFGGVGLEGSRSRGSNLASTFFRKKNANYLQAHDKAGTPYSPRYEPSDLVDRRTLPLHWAREIDIAVLCGARCTGKD